LDSSNSLVIREEKTKNAHIFAQCDEKVSGPDLFLCDNSACCVVTVDPFNVFALGLNGVTPVIMPLCAVWNPESVSCHWFGSW